jgi:hypothetical protein
MLEKTPGDLSSQDQNGRSVLGDVSNKSQTDNNAHYGSRQKQSFLQSKSTSKLATPTNSQNYKKMQVKPAYFVRNQENSNSQINTKSPLRKPDVPQHQPESQVFTLMNDQPSITDNLQINYLNDQRLSFLADSMQVCNDKNSSLVVREFGATAEKETARNIWQKRFTIDNEYGLLSKLDSTTKLEKKVTSKILENSTSFGDLSANLMKTKRLSNLKEFISPTSKDSNLGEQMTDSQNLDKFLKAEQSPSDFLIHFSDNQGSKGSDIVRHEESSNSQDSRKFNHGMNLNLKLPAIQHFEFEDLSTKPIVQHKLFKELVSDRKQDPEKASQLHGDGSLIYAVGGSSEKEQMTIEAFDSTAKSWREVFRSNLPLECRSKFGAILLNKKEMLIFGGKTSSRRFSNSILIELGRGVLKEHVFKLSEAKSGFGYCVLNSTLSLSDKLFVCGGNNGHSILDTFECYDLTSGVHSSMPPLKCGRDEVALVYAKGELYAIGGGGKEGESLKSVERYSFSRGEWTTEADMLIERRAHAALVVQDQIFVIGGFDGEKYLHSCEKYAHLSRFDPYLSIWLQTKSMESARCTLAAAVTADQRQ